MPTLVVVNERDPIHPLPLGVELAQGIPNARLVQVPSKSESLDAHRDGCREVIWGFLNEVIEATSD
jgi:pimeloyl-ACP methyl ester carboxylesterase